MRDSTRLRRALLDAGLSRPVLDAAWPDWWDAGDEGNPAARSELRRTLSRRLGLAAGSLSGDRVEFVWRDDVRFKNLAKADDETCLALVSFARSVGHLLLTALPCATPVVRPDAAALRRLLLGAGAWVDLSGLLATAWGLGIPVVHLRVFPLPAKAMQAMVVAEESRFAILLGRDARYHAPLAFTLAHELGHVFLGHLDGQTTLLDFEPDGATPADEEESAADAYAMTLLTGTPQPRIDPGAARYTAASLAASAMAAGRTHGIEPGTLALVHARQANAWPIAMKALSMIYDRPVPVWEEINIMAASRLDWGACGEDGNYLKALLGLPAG